MPGHRLRRATGSLRHERGGDAYAVPRGAAGSGVTQHEAEQRHAREVDTVGRAPELDVIAEELGDLTRVRRAADGRQEGNVVGDLEVGGRGAEALAEPQREQARPQDVLRGLTEPQVHPERERGDQLGTPQGAVAGRFHAANPRAAPPT